LQIKLNYKNQINEKNILKQELQSICITKKKPSKR